MLIETRGNDGILPKEVTFYEAILHPRASFGGLYTLKDIPQIDLNYALNLTYSELVRYIFDKLCVNLALDSALDSYQRFDYKNAPLSYSKIDENLILQNLYTGPTRAFKDMAMQPFGDILCALAKTQQKSYLVLTATSGDTGPATLEAIKDKPNVYGICMYPANGTSEVQKLQMTTIDSPNIKVLAVNGDFDDTQSVLKDLLKDEDFSEFLQSHNFALSATNSVNIGRIIFQIIYHIDSYLYLHRNGIINSDELINIIVPSGNFGNALGAFYAKKMGVKINKIVIATNENDVLCELINNGVYDICSRKLIKTNSPAMDILKSSNVERMLFSLFGALRTRELMESLENNKRYTINSDELSMIRNFFDASSANNNAVLEMIKKYATNNIIIDPHTANGIVVYENMQHTYQNIKSIVCSTAEWSKFAPTITKALGRNDNDKSAIDYIQTHFDIVLHQNIKKLFDCREIHYTVVNKDNIKSTIKSWLESL